MKKILVSAFALVMVFSFAACTDSKKGSGDISSKQEPTLSSSQISSTHIESESESESESQDIKSEVHKKADEALASVVTANMTELQKLKISYEWLYWHFKYRAAAVDVSGGYTDELTYDLASYYFKYHKGSCEHYAAAQKILFERLGYECMYVEGQRIDSKTKEWGEHVWLLVKVNGNWYHADGLFSGNHTANLNTLFCVPDSALENTHRWQKSNYPACTNPKITV